MERRIDGADGHGPAGHDLEDAGEVLPLKGQKLGQGGLALLEGVGQDHLAHRADLALAEEHVLGPAQADALGPEGHRVGRLVGLVGVGPDLEGPVLVGPGHDLGEGLVDRGLGRGQGLLDEDLEDLGGLGVDLAFEDLAGRAVDRDPVALLDRPALDRHGVGGVVDEEVAAAGDADPAHLPGDQGGVGGHAAAGRQDALGRVHALDVLGRGLDAGQDDLLAALGPGLGVDGVEDDAPGGGAGTGVEALGQQPAALDGGVLLGVVEDGPEELVELVRLDPRQGLLLADELLADHVDGDLDGGEGGALAHPALQHVELALLDGELDVHHVGVVLLEGVPDLLELRVGLGVVLLELDDRLGRPGAGHDVLALGVHEVLAVEDVLAGGRVAGEGDAGARVVAHVAEDHELDVDGRAPGLGDVVHLAVGDGPVVHPGAEHGADRAPELLAGIVGEFLAGLLLDGRLEAGDQVLEVGGGQVGVGLDAAGVLLLLDDGLEGVDVVLVDGLEAEDDVAVHLDEAAVGVVDEALVAGLGDQGGGRPVVEAEVEDGVHHARHGGPGAGADGDEKRALRDRRRPGRRPFRAS